MDDGRDVQDPVDAPVSEPAQPVAALVAGGRFDRGGPLSVLARPAVQAHGDAADRTLWDPLAHPWTFGDRSAGGFVGGGLSDLTFP